MIIPATHKYISEKRNEWKINDGKVESVKCEDMVMEIKDTATTVGSSIVLAPDNDRGWNQGWSIKSNAARLLTDNGDSSQEWKAIFVQPNYDYALLPGFPVQYNVRKVRVQLNGTNYLSLREVQVFDYGRVDRALNQPAMQSSNYSSHLDFSASKAVNGDLADYSSTRSEEGEYLLLAALSYLCFI